MTHERVLLDTSVVITPPADGLSSLGARMAVSTITIAELEYGLRDEPDPLDADLRRRRLAVTVEMLDVVTFDRPAARTYGLLAAMLRAAGRNPRPRRFDLLIAATAVRHGLPLATRNADDFKHLERALTVIPVED